MGSHCGHRLRRAIGCSRCVRRSWHEHWLQRFSWARARAVRDRRNTLQPVPFPGESDLSPGSALQEPSSHRGPFVSFGCPPSLLPSQAELLAPHTPPHDSRTASRPKGSEGEQHA
eukprot:scaffold69688_cov32-Tisochrysis_lutea.AAC.1